MLAAKLWGKSAFEFRRSRTRGHDARARLHLELMNSGAERGGVPLFQAAKLHGSFGQGEALHAAHGVVGGEKQI